MKHVESRGKVYSHEFRLYTASRTDHAWKYHLKSELMDTLKSTHSCVLHLGAAQKQVPRTTLCFGGLRSQDSCPVLLESSHEQSGFSPTVTHGLWTDKHSVDSPEYLSGNTTHVLPNRKQSGELDVVQTIYLLSPEHWEARVLPQQGGRGSLLSWGSTEVIRKQDDIRREGE